MSRTFTKNVSNYLSLGANTIGTALGTATGYSFAFWIKCTSKGANDAPFQPRNGSSSSVFGTNLTGCRVYAARIIGDTYTASYNPSYTPANGSWVHLCWTVDWSTNPRAFAFYANGAPSGSGTFAIAGGSYSHTSSSEHDFIAAASGGSVPFSTAYQVDGLMANIAMWNKVLNDGDALALGGGCSPLRVQPQSLIMFHPLNGQGSPEVDVIGRLSGNITGSVPVGDHPRTFS